MYTRGRLVRICSPVRSLGEAHRVSGQGGFQFRLNLAQQRPVVVAERQPAEQPQAHRLRRSWDLVEQLRIEPPFGQAAAVRAAASCSGRPG